MSELVAPPPSETRDRVGWLVERRWLLAWFAGSRVVVFGCAAIVHLARGPSGRLDPSYHGSWFGLLTAWDGHWYREVAVHGYLLIPGAQSDPAFFPFFPLLLRWFAQLGVSPNTSGIVLANLFFLLALLLFHELSTLLRGEAAARRATILLAIFPLGFVFSMVYPTSLLLATMAGAVLLALRGKWRWTALVMAIACLTRPEALLVLPPLAAILVRQWRLLDHQARGAALGAFGAGPAALAAYASFLGWALGDPLAWSHAQLAWDRRFGVFGIFGAIADLPAQLASHPWYSRDLVFVVLYLGVLAVAYKRGVGLAWVLSGLGVVLLPLESGTIASAGRFGLAAFAVFWGYAELSRNRRVDLAVRAASLISLIAWTLTLPLVNP